MACGFDANEYPPANPIVQQTFMGLSIMDFSINLGFNSNSSSLSVNLVRDEANYHTWLDLNGCRDAVTEGYHPWDKKAFPKDLIAYYGGTPPYPLHKQDVSGDLPHFPPPGSPVYFNYYNGYALNAACTGATYRYCEPVFSFPGILTKFERAWGSSGETYSASITDPRQILENTKVLLDGYAGRTAPADGHFNVDSTRVFDQGWNGYYNIINVYGYYENHRFQQSGKTEGGMQWFAPSAGPLTNEYGANSWRGILPAIDFLISGTNKNYIEAMEPFGGPLYYNEDFRQLGLGGSENPPFGLQKNLSTQLPYNVHRYAVDLSELYNLSAYYNPNPPAPGVLPDDFRISGESMSLLQIIQQVTEAAGCDFFVWLYVPRHPKMQYWNTHRNYSGIIKVTPIRKDLNIRTGILKDAFDQSILVPPKGPWVDAEQNSTVISANLGYEFTDPASGQMLLGAPRTRVVGVTPLGNYQLREELWFNTSTQAYLDTRAGGPKEGRDDILKEFLPSTESDGVHLKRQMLPLDEFSDKEEKGWNPYSDTSAKGVDGRPDFKQNLPMVSNDDYLPFHSYYDYAMFGVDPFQFNRVNSKEWEDEENGSSGFIDLFPCWGMTTEASAQIEIELNDIVDKKRVGRPIKGFFWDDDPYRDFHPVDGIFGALEFINPGLGKCIAIKNPKSGEPGHTDNSDDAGNSWIIGQPIDGLENLAKVCECNYQDADPTTSCAKKGSPIPGKFQSYCKNHTSCHAKDGSLIEGFANDAGQGNTYHLTKYGCERGCFKKGQGDIGVGKPIVAYYTADYGEGPNAKSKGEKATRDDQAWKDSPPGADNSILAWVDSEADCQESATLAGAGVERISGYVGADGASDVGAAGDRNTHESTGGLYDSRCKSSSMRKPCISHCHDNGVPTDELDPQKCNDAGHTWFDAIEEGSCDPFYDAVRDIVIDKKDNPIPGYTSVRVKAVMNSKDELIPIQPRTATIPIDFSQIGFEGGPNGDRNYGATGAKHWYYATVTELRHAAVSKDSWIAYLRELGQFLPCQMYSQNPDQTSVWKEYCAAQHGLLIKGGSSETDLAADGNIQSMAGHSVRTGGPPWPKFGNQEKGSAEAAGGHPCGENVNNAELTPYEKTSMEVDIAYKKVQEVATQYYGRKYLMPLPFNPPTAHICSNPKLRESKCEDQGYDWGPHGMLSDWFAMFGVGHCEGWPVAPDRASCVQAGGTWIDPSKQINKWEIVGAGWPGGDVNFDFDSGSFFDTFGYPRNMNFWSEDGNLEAFVLYPSQDYQRLSGAGKPLDFRGIDPEQVSDEYWPDLGVNAYNYNYGKKMYVKVNVDPKTHWMPVRPDWELQNEKQYYMFRAGDPNTKQVDVIIGENQNGVPIVEKHNIPEDYLTIGPEDNEKEIKGIGDDERPVFIKSGEDNDFKTYMAMKPYALITIPSQVQYGSVDKGSYQVGMGGDKNEMCIPLAKCKNANCLTSAWSMGQDPNGIAAQQLQAMAKSLKSMPILAPDLGRGSIAPAAYKPFHAAVPQQSKHYKWGPWALGIHFGKPEFKIDESVHPAVYGGETRMGNFALNKVKAALSKSQRFLETGSVTLAGLPAYAFGSQMMLNINGTLEAGPYVTDMSISMGSGGLNTTYNFSTQRKFGDLGEIYEKQIKDMQKEMVSNKKRLEEEIQRTRRGRDSYRR